VPHTFVRTSHKKTPLITATYANKTARPFRVSETNSPGSPALLKPDFWKSSEDLFVQMLKDKRCRRLPRS